jgi:hypothetical protein
MEVNILFKRVAIISLLAMVATYFTKDTLPSAEYYGNTLIKEPTQNKSSKKPFEIEANKEHYHITPKYKYNLEGVVVSTHNSDAFLDMAHHEEWRDFINMRDLCVIWGDNVKSGVYKEMQFENGNWTCWYSWPNANVRQRFRNSQLSNNHLLAGEESVKKAILEAQPGDHIHLEGMLVNYTNPANNFKRGTSITRTDTGQGACETIYVEKFDIIKKANAFKRVIFNIAKFFFILSIIALLYLFIISLRKPK